MVCWRAPPRVSRTSRRAPWVLGINHRTSYTPDGGGGGCSYSPYSASIESVAPAAVPNASESTWPVLSRRLMCVRKKKIGLIVKGPVLSPATEGLVVLVILTRA